ncbi:hypothetical protein PFISCL1PPCAC_8385, partial [Pristionchus fissidentatus]
EPDATGTPVAQRGIYWQGDPIANWSIAMREAMEEEDAETVEALLSRKLLNDKRIRGYDGAQFPSADRREVQEAMAESVVNIACFHGFEDFDLPAVSELTNAMANYMESLCKDIRLNRRVVKDETGQCSFFYSGIYTLLNTWEYTLKPGRGLRGLVSWYAKTYREPAIRTEISARNWLQQLQQSRNLMELVEGAEEQRTHEEIIEVESAKVVDSGEEVEENVDDDEDKLQDYDELLFGAEYQDAPDEEKKKDDSKSMKMANDEEEVDVGGVEEMAPMHRRIANKILPNEDLELVAGFENELDEEEEEDEEIDDECFSDEEEEPEYSYMQMFADDHKRRNEDARARRTATPARTVRPISGNIIEEEMDMDGDCGEEMEEEEEEEYEEDDEMEPNEVDDEDLELGNRLTPEPLSDEEYYSA